MANIPIPNLPLAISLDGTEQLAAVQYGTSVRVTTGQIAGLAGDGGVTSIIAGTGISVDQSTGDVTVTGVTPGDPANSMQYNNAGAFGGSSMTYDNVNETYNIPVPAGFDVPSVVIHSPSAGESGLVDCLHLIGPFEATFYALSVIPYEGAPNNEIVSLVSSGASNFSMEDWDGLQFFQYAPSINRTSLGNQDGVVEIPSITTRLSEFTFDTVSALSSLVGARATIVDSVDDMTGNYGAVISGGGAYAVPAFYDGINWRIG